MAPFGWQLPEAQYEVETESLEVCQPLQAPLTHVSPEGHWCAQAPQWFGSFDRLAQPTVLPQFVSPEGQVHVPLTQLAPGPQTVAHAPQWFESFETSTQPVALPQFVWPDGQVQTPLAQLAPGPQIVPQWPQFCPSFDRSTHVPLQIAVPAGQTQAPLTHMWLVVQA
jgi:hypothetical protein